MPAGGRLTVTTSATDDAERPVTISVADTGPGIPAEIRAKIFDPFFSTKAGGTGLGLALTQQIVVEHGGSIDVDSAAGRGTRFVVRLPALAPEEPAARPALDGVAKAP
jgi:signal transduction histidine kinase